MQQRGQGQGRVPRQRRARGTTARPFQVTVRLSAEEYAQASARAAAERMALAGWMARAALNEGRAVPAGDVDRSVLAELIGLHRQVRGACTNLNQAVAKLHSLGQPVAELPVIAARVDRLRVELDRAVTAAHRALRR